MPTTDFITWLERFGFPVAVVLALSLAVWRVLIWLGQRIIEPLTAKHIEFLEEATRAAASNAASIEKLTELAERSESTHSSLVARLDNNGRLLEKLVDRLDTFPAPKPARKTQIQPPTS